MFSVCTQYTKFSPNIVHNEAIIIIFGNFDTLFYYLLGLEIKIRGLAKTFIEREFILILILNQF